MRTKESAAVSLTGGNLDGRGRIPDEQRLLNAGPLCGAGASEAPRCAGKKVFIVGGGNSTGQAAMNFARTAESVTLIVRVPSLAATLSHYLLDRIAHTSNVRVQEEPSAPTFDLDAARPLYGEPLARGAAIFAAVQFALMMGATASYL